MHLTALQMFPQRARHKLNIPPEFQQQPTKILSGLESEYVGNLQQQLYLLELELKFLRERATASGPSIICILCL